MSKVVYFTIGLFFFIANGYAATLAEINWPTAGTSEVAISSDGYFTSADVQSTAFEVIDGASDGPEGRNYLRIKNPVAGAFWLKHDGTYAGWGSPDIVVMRFWHRASDVLYLSNRHNVILDDEPTENKSSPGTGFWALNRTTSDDSSENVEDRNELYFEIGSGTSYVSYALTDGADWYSFEADVWYLFEYRINRSAATVEVRIDGVDVTNSYYKVVAYNPDTLLSSDNGSLPYITPYNCIKFDTYDKETNSVGAALQDFAGVMITDGPDWIEGATPTHTTPTRTGSSLLKTGSTPLR